MPSPIGYFDILKSVAGKVFVYLASITLTGTDGKTVTVTQDTSLDEAVAMSSKAPKASPVFTGTVTAPVIKTASGSTLCVDTVATTIITTIPQGACLIVAYISGESFINCTLTIRVPGATQDRVELLKVGSINISLSGASVRCQQISGADKTVTWMYLRLDI